MLSGLGFRVGPEFWTAAILTLLPLILAAFLPNAIGAAVQRMPRRLRLFCPSLLCIPYVFVTYPRGQFRLEWFALYALLPVAVAVLLSQARKIDPARRGTWRDFLVLAVLGLAVDLRWFEAAWPSRLAIFNKMLLLDAGIYGFQCVRGLDHTGFDLRLRLRDFVIGLREFGWYAPIAVALGLVLGFLNVHAVWPGVRSLSVAFLFTFAFIAIPEELFFRGWLQNLLERRIGRMPALLTTAILFGLSHFNKRALHFNWRYVLLAAIAGIFYGRAWRQEHRIGASAITHACVDAVWSQWLR